MGHGALAKKPQDIPLLLLALLLSCSVGWLYPSSLPSKNEENDTCKFAGLFAISNASVIGMRIIATVS